MGGGGGGGVIHEADHAYSPGDYIVSFRCTIYSLYYQLAKYSVTNLDLSNFLVEPGLLYFDFLSICLLLVYFYPV